MHCFAEAASGVSQSGESRSKCGRMPSLYAKISRLISLPQKVAATRGYAGVSPNVKDEPRPWLARRVRHDDLESEISFDYS